MKSAIFFITLSVCAYMCLADEEHYTTEFDNINTDDVINNKRLMDQYIKCLLGEGKCTREGTTLKEHLPQALESKCAKCSEKQKEGAAKMIRHLMEKEPESWQKLVNKYDPEGKFMQEYAEDLKTIKGN